jgi:hypothetical protein
MDNNIYLELELFLDPAVTDSVALKNELEQNISTWNKNINISPKYGLKVKKAREYITAGFSDLQTQASDARESQLAKLRNDINELSLNGELQQFEIDYLKRTFSCFSEETIRSEIKNISRSLTSNSGGIVSVGQGNVLQNVYGNVSNVGNVVGTQLPKIAASLRTNPGLVKWILIIPLLLILLYVLSYIPSIVGGMLRAIPIPSLQSQSYKRGTGSYITRYAKRSYNNAKWEKVNLPEEANVTSIAGWDKENFTVTIGNGVYSFSKGNWTKNDFPGSMFVQYVRPDLYVVFAISNPGQYHQQEQARIYDKNSYKEFPLGRYFNGTYQLKNDEFFILHGDHSLYQYHNEKITEVTDREQLVIWDKSQKIGGIDGNALIHSFREGSAVGHRFSVGFIKYRDGKWQVHHSTTHKGNVYSIWAIDEDNFVAVGGDITVFRDGKEIHPLIESSGKTFNKEDCRVVWGVDLDLFWVMDNSGNIAEFRNGQAAKIIVDGNISVQNSIFTRVWVSPEGVVFAVGDDRQLHRLD